MSDIGRFFFGMLTGMRVSVHMDPVTARFRCYPGYLSSSLVFFRQRFADLLISARKAFTARLWSPVAYAFYTLTHAQATIEHIQRHVTMTDQPSEWNAFVTPACSCDRTKAFSFFAFVWPMLWRIEYALWTVQCIGAFSNACRAIQWIYHVGREPCDSNIFVDKIYSRVCFILSLLRFKSIVTCWTMAYKHASKHHTNRNCVLYGFRFWSKDTHDRAPAQPFRFRITFMRCE